MEKIEKQTYDIVFALVDEVRKSPHCDPKSSTDSILSVLGLELPKESPFPEISPTPWRFGEGDYDCWIFDNDDLTVGCIGNEANKALMLTAPALMKTLYAIEKVWAANGVGPIGRGLRDGARQALRDAGVRLEAM